MTRFFSVLACAGATIVTSCVATTFTARPDADAAGPAVHEQRAPASFWEAMDNLDVEAATLAAVSGEQKHLTSALASMLGGRTDDAISVLRSVWASTTDAETHKRTRDLLEGLLLSRSRWTEILDLYSQDTGPVDPIKDTRPLVKVYAGAPAEHFQFANQEDTVPMTLNAAGLPVADVFVNGHRRRFILDTAASMTAMSSDVARECGVVPAAAAGLAGTTTTKTVAIRAAVVGRLQFGQLVITDHPVFVVDPSRLRFKLLGLVTLFKIDGVLGWNAIRGMNLRLNYRDQRAVIAASRLQRVASRNLFDLGDPVVVLGDDLGRRFHFLLDLCLRLHKSAHDPRAAGNLDPARRSRRERHRAQGFDDHRRAERPFRTAVAGMNGRCRRLRHRRASADGDSCRRCP